MRFIIGKRVVLVDVTHYPDAVEINGHLCVGYDGNGPPTPIGVRCLRCGQSIVGGRSLESIDYPCPGSKKTKETK